MMKKYTVEKYAVAVNVVKILNLFANISTYSAVGHWVRDKWLCFRCCKVNTSVWSSLCHPLTTRWLSPLWLEQSRSELWYWKLSASMRSAPCPSASRLFLHFMWWLRSCMSAGCILSPFSKCRQTRELFRNYRYYSNYFTGIFFWLIRVVLCAWLNWLINLFCSCECRADISYSLHPVN